MQKQACDHGIGPHLHAYTRLPVWAAQPNTVSGPKYAHHMSDTSDRVG